jgi:hypothetical protein
MRFSTRLAVASIMSVLALALVPAGAATAHQAHTNLLYCCK